MSAVTRYNSAIILASHSVRFPIDLRLGPYLVSAHLFFEAVSYIAAFAIYLRLRHRFGDPLVAPLRWTTIAAAIAGAAFGSKLLFWLEDPRQTIDHLHDPAYLLGGKTIVGALIFGVFLVELVKRQIGLRTSTGDLYAIPLAVGISIGRIGCFLTGLPDNTYGTPSDLPWAVDFGDGIPRHPTQLYEIVFLLALIPALLYVLKRITGNSGSPILAKDSVILSEAVTKRSEVAAQSKDLVSSLNEATVQDEKHPAIAEPSSKTIPVILSEAATKQSEVTAQSKDPVPSATTSGSSRNPAPTPPKPQASPVILSEAATKRSEVAAQSKDPVSSASEATVQRENHLAIEAKISPVILSEAVTKRSEVAAQSKDLIPPAATSGSSRNSAPGDAFKLFMVAYMTFRLLCDFIKPYPRIYLGLGGIQWACVLTLLYYVPDIVRWIRPNPLDSPDA